MPDSYTVERLADRWAVSTRTITRMITAGELDTFRVRRSIRITGESVARVEAGQSPPPRRPHRAAVMPARRWV